MNLSYGFVETRGMVAALEAADAMLKAARVELVRYRRVGGALVLVIIRGELSACQAAVSAGQAAAQRVGQLVSGHVIPNPFQDTAVLVEQWLRKGRGKGKKKTARSREPQKAAPRSLSQRIVAILSRFPQGIALKDLAQQLGVDLTQLRPVIKEMMDGQQVEKVRHLYFLVKSGKKP